MADQNSDFDELRNKLWAISIAERGPNDPPPLIEKMGEVQKFLQTHDLKSLPRHEREVIQGLISDYKYAQRTEDPEGRNAAQIDKGDGPKRPVWRR